LSVANTGGGSHPPGGEQEADKEQRQQ